MVREATVSTHLFGTEKHQCRDDIRSPIAFLFCTGHAFGATFRLGAGNDIAGQGLELATYAPTSPASLGVTAAQC